MDYKRYRTFFHQSDLFRLSGAGLLILGLFLFVLAWSLNGNTYILFALAAPCVVAGFVLFLITSAQNVSEGELKEDTGKLLADVEVNVDTDHELAGKMMLRQEPHRIEGAIYEDGADLFRRGKNNTVLSNVYMRSILCFTNEYFVIRARKVWLTEDKKEDIHLRLSWNEVENAVLTPYLDRVLLANAHNTSAPVHCMYLDINGINGERLFRSPIHDDMDAEALRDLINKIIAANRQ